MLEPLAAIHDDADVIRYIGGRQRWAGGAAAERLAEYMADYRRLGFSKWAIVLKGTGELVGRCGPVVEMIEGISEIELGCTLGRRYWGAGYATEAMVAALEQSFRLTAQRRIVSLAHAANSASQRLVTRLGMTHERNVEWHGGAVPSICEDVAVNTP